MTSPTVAGIDLMELASRVETASGPNRDLDALIAPLAGLTIVDEGHPIGRMCYDDIGAAHLLPRYTASLDAAMTLVPEGWYWMAGNRDRLTPRAYVENGQPAFMGYSSRRNPYRLWFEVTAATPALALTAAALRARSSLIEEERS